MPELGEAFELGWCDLDEDDEFEVALTFYNPEGERHVTLGSWGEPGRYIITRKEDDE